MAAKAIATLLAALLVAPPAIAWDEADLANAKASGDCYGCNLAGADLAGAALQNANLSDANLRGADLSGAILDGVILLDANLRGAKLAGASLTDAILSDANLDGADLSGAFVDFTDFTGASLQGTNVTGTDMRGAMGADLAAAIDHTPKPAPLPTPAPPPTPMTGLKYGSVFLTAASFCPAGTLHADGATLPIAGNEGLYSLYGDNYGSDNKTQFNLPDLRGELPVPGLRYCVVVSGTWPARS